MVARLKKYALWFSIGSLILFTGSFFIKNAAQIPLLSRMFCDRSVAARAGVATLLSTDTLSPRDAGFSELAGIVTANITNSRVATFPKIQEFKFSGFLGLAEHGPASTGEVAIQFSDGQSLKCSEKFLEDMVQKDFDSRILFWSSVFFVLGLLDGIWGLFLKYSPQKKPTAERTESTVEIASQAPQNSQDAKLP